MKISRRTLLAAGTADILMEGDASVWMTNDGTAVGFTTTGTLTNAATDPP